MQKTKKIGFALIGCGGIANFHAKAIKAISDAELVGVYDYSIEFAEKFAKNYDAKVFKTVDQLLSSKDVDVVNICTPSGLHAEYAIAAANAKKHIVIEKPMAITKEQLSGVIKAVKDNGVKVEVITQLRFTPTIVALKKAIDEGRLGKILIADYRMKYYRSPEYYKQGGWRGTWKMDGGGALMNQGIHGIDLIQYLLGGIKSVYADCRTLAREIEVEDTANILVEYTNGAVGIIQGTTLAEPGYPRSIEITGTKGTVIIKEDVIEHWDVAGENNPLPSKNSSVGAGSDPLALSEAYHKLQLEDLIKAINENKKPLVNEDEGRKPVDIILAAYQSSKTKQKVEV